MIPLHIQIKNFLSYGPNLQTIDFSSYQLICLSGKNGHGKSALLDAITWALWGQARKVGGSVKADHGLVRLGQTQMMVIFDFICNDNHYRVRREFAITYGKPYAALEFALVGEDEAVESLTEKTIRDTQKKIEDTLRLDYDAFINSAFLRQGQANEFSKKSPKDRKEILANILGLQRFEDLRQAAQDKVRHATMQHAQLCALQEKLTTQLAHEQEAKDSYAKIIGQLEQEHTVGAALQQEQLALQQEEAVLQKKELERQHLCTSIEGITTQQIAQQQRVRACVHQWRTTHRTIRALPKQETIIEQKANLEQVIAAHASALEQRLTYKEQQITLQQELITYQQQLEKRMQASCEQDLLAVHKAELAYKQAEHSTKLLEEQCKQRTAEYTAHQQQQIKLVNHLATTADAAKKYKEEEKVFEKRKAFYQQWRSQITWLKKEFEATEQKIELCHDDSSTGCPLCEQNLSAARKKFIHQKLVQSKQTLYHRMQRLAHAVAKLKDMLIEQNKILVGVKKEMEAHTIAEHTAAQLHKDMLIIHNELLQLQQTLAEQHKRTGELQAEHARCIAHHAANTTTMQQHINNDPERIQRQQHLATVTQQLADVRYDAATHKADAARYETIKQQLQQCEQILHMQRSQTERMQEVITGIAELKHLGTTIAALQKSIMNYATLATAVTDAVTRKKQLQQRVDELTVRKEQLLEQKGRLEQQLNAFKTMAHEQKEQQTQLAQLTEQMEDYQTIAQAFGKNGMQALLIEDAIPEIEQAANELLSRLTDNQSHIMIESLRDLKSGGTKETLDIKISDNAGIRPYEMFSGGEAFRIDFALRIAISKLLARRAGTSLQTLIIDEGFGSQDEEGIGHIMEAIYRIRDDFKKIVIVSHLTAMKDQFPVHFLIHKGPHGSLVQIIEQA